MKKNLIIIIITGLISTMFSCSKKLEPVEPDPDPIDCNFTQSELNQISKFMELLPEKVRNGFKDKIDKWGEAGRSELRSFPCSPSKIKEYDSLLIYCKQYGKASWPLVFDRVAKAYISICPLLKDLTIEGNPDYLDHISLSLTIPGKYFPSNEDVLNFHCKKLLEKEKDNILKVIHELIKSENN